MKFILSLSILTFLTSCNIFHKTGLEKRIYRPGYFFNFSQNQKTQTKQIKGTNEERNPSNNYVIIDNEAKKYPHLTTSKIPTTIYTSTIPKKERIIRINNYDLKENKWNPSNKKYSTKAVQKTPTNNKVVSGLNPHSDVNGWGILIFVIILGLLAWALTAIFPTLSFVTAEIILLGSVLLICLLLALLIK